MASAEDAAAAGTIMSAVTSAPALISDGEGRPLRPLTFFHNATRFTLPSLPSAMAFMAAST